MQYEILYPPESKVFLLEENQIHSAIVERIDVALEQGGKGPNLHYTVQARLNKKTPYLKLERQESELFGTIESLLLSLAHDYGSRSRTDSSIPPLPAGLKIVVCSTCLGTGKEGDHLCSTCFPMVQSSSNDQIG